jgi:hypothetical protein
MVLAGCCKVDNGRQNGGPKRYLIFFVLGI